jgi:predicted DNA-binding transcriptional regulator AlpA
MGCSATGFFFVAAKSGRPDRHLLGGGNGQAPFTDGRARRRQDCQHTIAGYTLSRLLGVLLRKRTAVDAISSLMPNTLRVLTFVGVARQMGVTAQTLRAWIKDRPDFPKPVLIGGRKWYRVADVAKWLEAQQQGGDQ